MERFDTLLLNLLIHEYICLFRFSFIPLYNVLQCSLYRFYTYFVKFTIKYFIFKCYYKWWLLLACRSKIDFFLYSSRILRPCWFHLLVLIVVRDFFCRIPKLFYVWYVFFSFFKKYLFFIFWLHRVLAVARGLFVAAGLCSCGSRT